MLGGAAGILIGGAVSATIEIGGDRIDDFCGLGGAIVAIAGEIVGVHLGVQLMKRGERSWRTSRSAGGVAAGLLVGWVASDPGADLLISVPAWGIPIAQISASMALERRTSVAPPS